METMGSVDIVNFKRPFKGTPAEDAENHWFRYKDVIDVLEFEGTPAEQESTKILLFRYTIADDARRWFNSVHRGINSVDELQNAFKKRYSKIGQSEADYQIAWENLKFQPEKEDVHTLAERVRTIGQLARYDDMAILEKFKRLMPDTMIPTLYGINRMGPCVQAAADLFKRFNRQQSSPLMYGSSGLGVAPNLNAVQLAETARLDRKVSKLTEILDRITTQEEEEEEDEGDSVIELLKRIEAKYQPNIKGSYKKKGFKPKQQGTKQTDKDGDRCYYCKQPGHMVRNCQKAKDRLEWANRRLADIRAQKYGQKAPSTDSSTKANAHPIDVQLNNIEQSFKTLEQKDEEEVLNDEVQGLNMMMT